MTLAREPQTNLMLLAKATNDVQKCNVLNISGLNGQV